MTKIYFIFFFIFTNFSLYASLDLENNTQDFVLETKKIEIADFEYPFNPSIVKWKDKILMSFRFREPPKNIPNQIGLIYLNDEFNPITKPFKLDQRITEFQSDNWAQDPRLIVIKNRLYIVFNNIGMTANPSIRRTCIAEIFEDDCGFYINDPEFLLYFDGENPNVHEKNWTPFEYEEKMHLIYCLSPLRIFKPHFGTQSCETLVNSSQDIQWDWGELRGGTSAALENGEYLTFFHTCKKMASVQSEGKLRDHYFMGACTFKSTPPFSITKISPAPIVGKQFYNGPLYKTWKPLHVVFPGGFISKKEHIWIVYGRQDHECWAVKLNKQGLLDSLQPI
ncbi:MAG: hypothetical protein Q8K60_08770 [Parachlamydiaceae bacterium]|nr:hypothetical protein [Parachlamydiaceae bacterium]